MKKAVTWILWIVFAAFLIDCSIIGVKLLDRNYEFIVEAYIGLVCLAIMFVCIILRIIGNKCPHCGKSILTNGEYCSYCGEKIIGISTDSKYKQRRLSLIICIILVISIAALSVIGTMLFHSNRPQNKISPLDKNSIEMKTAELLSGTDGAFIYKYTTTDIHNSLKVYMSEYQSGVLVKKEVVGSLEYEEIGSPKNGTILIVPDFNKSIVKLIIENDGTKISTEMPILEGVPEREYYGRSSTEITDTTPISYNEEQGLVALIYGRNYIRTIDLQELMAGKTDSLSQNDYVYCFSFEFYKE